MGGAEGNGDYLAGWLGGGGPATGRLWWLLAVGGDCTNDGSHWRGGVGAGGANGGSVDSEEESNRMVMSTMASGLLL